MLRSCMLTVLSVITLCTEAVVFLFDAKLFKNKIVFNFVVYLTKRYSTVPLLCNYTV